MSAVQATRDLLGPADPARGAPVAPPRLTALEVIGLAAPVRRRRPSRRLVLAAAAATVAAGAAAVVSTRTRPVRPSGPEVGTVLEPIAYQYGSGAPPAGARLRALADAVTDAPYETHTGRYAYHHTRLWGDPVMSDASDRYVMGYASESWTWRTDDGTGTQRDLQLEPQFPDPASRDYYQSRLPHNTPVPHSFPLPPSPVPPLPTDRAGLADRIQTRYGPGAVTKFLPSLYTTYVVPRAVRAQLLRVLADLPAWVWRGSVTDRAGRPGVAITADDPEYHEQFLLVFDPTTGGLLASELLTLRPVRISTYLVVLDTDRTDAAS